MLLILFARVCNRCVLLETAELVNLPNNKKKKERERKEWNNMKEKYGKRKNEKMSCDEFIKIRTRSDAESVTTNDHFVIKSLASFIKKKIRYERKEE